MAKKKSKSKKKVDPRRRWADAVARNLVASGACERLEDAEEGVLLLRKADRHIYLHISFDADRRLSARVDLTLDGYKTVAAGQSPGQGEQTERYRPKKQSIVLEAAEGKPVSLKSNFKHSKLATTGQILRDLADVIDVLDAALKKAQRQYSRAAATTS